MLTSAILYTTFLKITIGKKGGSAIIVAVFIVTSYTLDMEDVSRLKQEQRAAGIAVRKALVRDEAAMMSREICTRLLGHRFYKDASVIFSHKPFAGEADISQFNGQALKDGKTVAYPICYDNGKMVAAVPNSPADVVEGRYGIIAPMISNSRIISPKDIDLVIVPCAAFDGANLSRIGMGAGYYDRFLPLCEMAKRIAVAFEAQHIGGIITEKWDAKMHAIITESSYYT